MKQFGAELGLLAGWQAGKGNMVAAESGIHERSLWDTLTPWTRWRAEGEGSPT